jgi:hypothetical protein
MFRQDGVEIIKVCICPENLDFITQSDYSNFIVILSRASESTRSYEAILQNLTPQVIY